jgi:CBS domain containing-hemolysin-like protein
VLSVLEQFKAQPVRMAIVVDEYGALQGLVTQTDLLEAIAGDIADTADSHPEVFVREDGSLLVDGSMSAVEAFARLEIVDWPRDEDFHTIAGFVLSRLARMPEEGDQVTWGGWRFEVVDMDGRRIDKLLVSRQMARA